MKDGNRYANGQKVQELKGNRLTFFFKTGVVKAEGAVESGAMEGEWKFYRETGQLWQVGNFLNDKKHGSWVRYDRNGEIEYNEIFAQGKLMKK